jgi:hypothetical protein
LLGCKKGFGMKREKAMTGDTHATVIHPSGATNRLVLSSGESARLRQLQEIVGGPIEGVPLSDGRYMLMSELGKDGPHLLNQVATDLARANESIMSDDYIAGVAVVLPVEALE